MGCDRTTQQSPQKYLHPMPDADTKNLTVLNRIRNA
jgi:hypothetical protein